MANFKLLLLQFCLFLLIFFGVQENIFAESLKERVNQFPSWNHKPSVDIAKGDLYYPEWMAGTWKATSTLIEQFAPLAPTIVTPGFEDNEQYLNVAIAFPVRFVQRREEGRGRRQQGEIGEEFNLFSNSFRLQKRLLLPNLSKTEKPTIVADRVFNGKSIAQAYLGAKNVLNVKVDPDNPNKQITLLQGKRRLISTITRRGSETPNNHEFLATEVSRQLFRSPERIYLNEVETTSDYQLMQPGKIQAQQITAIYLSPQDPDFFRAKNRPVAIYRYQLDLVSTEIGD